ncbi:NAD-dependent epimerase/dehydratase family protein [Neolewinella antarctica]|uniref:Nucleoside-diphosphate-sugar epimerase n=1 Tax=Neolewinella antarctica TaxID=442734 RepID=A0ABX0XFH2_9BACT|nr:NAD-dependent epimerase/dehydratase family protein [Neolewinella antarctica]NJC27528.1 nucleoside-diphosphate-sugar epimerase [Neolewinella antarctica]
MEDKLEKKVGILGVGWLGFALAESLLADGVAVHASSRQPGKLAELERAGADTFLVDLPQILPESFFTGLTHLVVTLPPGGRKLKAAATEDYLGKLRPLLPFLDASPDLRLIFCGTTGVYGDAEGAVDESTPVAPNTHSTRAVVAAETFFFPYADRLTVLRFAGLVGPGRHPGNFFGGKNFPLNQSDAPVNLVHQSDAVAALRLALATTAFKGVYNVCAAAHPPKGIFYGAAAGALGLTMGAEIAGGTTGKKIDSTQLRTAGWQPEHDELIIFLQN